MIYDGTAKNTLEVIGLEEGWHVSVTATKQGSSEPAATWEYTGKENKENMISGLLLTDAGTYNVQVVFTYPGHSEYEQKIQNLEVHIDHKQVKKPVAPQNMKYEPVSKERNGFEGQASEDWKFVDEGGYTHVGINAGKYTAKATLTNENYRWENTDEAVRDITIPWEILKRELYAPSISVNLYNYQYDKWVNPLVNPNSDYSFEVDKGTNTVKLVYIGNKTDENYDSNAAVAYTAANAYHTNRGKYLVTVTLNESGNYVWYGNEPSGLEWTINPATLTLPTIEAEGAVYTGEPYDAESLVTVKNDGVTLPGDVKKAEYQYSYDTTFRSPSNNAPINAGTYFVRQNYTYNNQNYIAVIPYASFTISPAEATMSFEKPTVEATYTTQGTLLQQVTVSGLVGQDTGEDEAVKKEVRYSYKYSQTPVEDWSAVSESTSISDSKNQKFTKVGYYQITAKWGTGTVSNNYTATPAIYTLTITKADEQKITLTSAGTNKGTWKPTEKTYTTTYGSEKTFTVTGTAALDAENAAISYEVTNDGANVVSVDSGSGMVTIKQAGEATITVTAAETANVGAASVEYTVTVKKAKPTVNTGLEGNKLEVAYTGKAIEGYDKATPTANVVEGAAKPTGDITYTFYTDLGCSDENKVTNGGGEENNIPIAVGTYYMKATYSGDENYLPAESEPVTVTVTKAQLTVDAEGHTGTYDGTEYPAIKVNSVTGNDTQLAEGNYTVKYAKTTEEEAPAATAETAWKDTLTVKDVADSTSGSQYYWYMVQDTAGNYEPKIEQVNVSITPAALQLNNVPDTYSKTYDGDNDVETDLNGITVTGIATEPISVTATGTYDNENAGEGKDVTLTLSLSGTDTWGNYSYNGAAPTDGQITLTQTGAGTITPKAITVTGISAENRVYDGTTDVELKGEPKTEDTLFNEDKTVSLALEEGAKGQLQDATAGNGKAVSVGNDAVEITGKGSDNYSVTVSLPNLTVDIEKATPTVTITGASDNKLTVAYTGNPVNIAATVAGISDTDKPTGEVTFRSYKSVEAAQNDTTGTGGTKLEEMPSNGGPYYLRAFIAEETNYKAAVSDYVELVIDATALSVTTGKPAEKSYTGTEHNMAQWADMKVQFSGKDVQYDVVFLKKGEDETSAPDAEDKKWNSGVSVITNVAESGEYWYKVTAKEGEGNFNPHVSTSAITFTVTPATLTLSSDLTKEKEYDGTTAAVVTEQKVTGAQNGENITVSSVSAAYDNANVGTGKTITITYTLSTEANLGNYKYNDKALAADMQTVSETVSDCSITQAPVTVTISDQTSVYDGEEPDVAQEKGTSEGDPKNWYVSEGTIYNSDNLGITLSVAPDSKDADTYAITGAWTNNNYKVTFTGSWTGEDENKDHAGTYTIDHRPINVQIGNAEGFYGDEPVLTGVTLTYEQTGDNRGLAPDEENVPGIELGTGANKESPVAEYTIYAVNGDGLNTPVVIGNYNVTFTKNGTYTVKPRPITITIKNHSSKYGAAIDDGIADPVSDKDYTVAITEGNTVTGGAIVNKDDLGIALFTTAKKGSDAGTYPISGTVTNTDLAKNYAITWKGQTPFTGEGEPDSTKATYTVEKAKLTVKAKQTAVYAQYGQETANPLTFTNASTGEEITVADSNYETLENAVTYTLNPPGSLTMEAENKAEGKFTVNVTDTTVTVEVNVAETDNFKAATMITYDVYTSASGSLTVDLPFADLTYTSEEQKLLTGAPTLPDDVVIRYKLGEKGTWTKYSDEAPNNWQSLVGTGAGDYTVYWETKAGGNYNASSGHETTEIKKADLSATYKGLNDSEVILVLSEMRDTYTIPLDLTGNKGYTHSNGDGVTFLSGNTDVAIAKNSTATLELRGVAGEAKITINCPGDNNYNPGTFTFTVTVTDQKAEILYDVTGTTTTYNGQPQTIAVKVTDPASGATVMYWNEETKEYDLSEPPAYTDVKAGGYPIKFQITAPGYETVIDEATLTINPKPITENMIAGIAESYTYTGKEITFDDAISVHDEGVLLEKDKDYTITYGDNKEVGKGSVTITGTGNYKESVTKNFTISPVDASDLSASLNRTFGYYRNSENNNATVTVTHGSHTVDSSEITLTVTRQDSTIESGDVVQEGLKLTFNKAGIYTIHVVVSGTHKGAFDLTYTLLPQDVASDGFQVAADPVDRVWTYDGENRAFGVTVTSGGTSLQKGVDFTLRYTYLPYVGSQEENEYDPESTEFTEAGIYTVIVEGTGNYTGHAELVALIQPRDLSDAGVTATFAQTELVYNGEAQEPGVTLTYNGTAITQLKDTEYYGNTNAGEAQALSAAREDCNNFTGARVDAFTIEKKSLKDSTITAKADPEEYYYTGYPVTPAVTVTDSDRNVDLSIGADYTVSSDAVGPGKVTATVTGTGNYKDTVTVEFTILPTGAEPVETLNLTVTPSEWTWDNGQTKAAISVTFNGTELNDTDYQLTVSKDGETPQTVTKAEAVELLSAPGEYTITATGVGAYNGSTDTETVTIQKIQPTVTVTATPNSLSGGGKVTLTLKGEKLPAFTEGQDLSSLLTASAKDEKNAPDLSELEWETDEQTGVMTAELTLPNTNETYTFTLSFVGNDYYESASSDAMVVVGQQTSGGGGGSDPGDQPANPDDTGVSDWLNTKEHLAYLAGYPGGIFGPDQNMTRAEAAQMFYNLLLEKDVEITVEFVDVPEDAWYATPVNTLASLGILSGVGNGRFDPERSITRAEFTVIAMKFANTSGGGVNIFSDVNEDDWFYSAVVDSTQYGWINGYPDGTFRPEATISRAEVTVIVNHMLGRAADRPYVIAHEEELNTFGDVNRGHWGYFHIAEATNAHEYHTEDGTESWTGLS